MGLKAIVFLILIVMILSILLNKDISNADRLGLFFFFLFITISFGVISSER